MGMQHPGHRPENQYGKHSIDREGITVYINGASQYQQCADQCISPYKALFLQPAYYKEGRDIGHAQRIDLRQIEI